MSIDLYVWSTPNGRKPLIMLEELGLQYNTHWINIGKGEQFTPEYIAINPNSKIPAIVDSTSPDSAVTVFESGAILIYLAEHYQLTQNFLPNTGAERARVIEWLMFQMGSIGPMFGQAYHFKFNKEHQIPYAIERYTNEAKRLYGVMDKQLADYPFIGGRDYSIADMATYPWVFAPDAFGIALADYPNVAAWVERVGSRPAVERAMNINP